MIFRRLRASHSALILGLSTLLTFAFMGVAHAAGPYTCTWTGGGDGTSFNDASNWSGCNSAAPQPADDDNLVFDNTSLNSEPNLDNNIVGLTVGNVQFTGSNTVYDDQLSNSGNAITITGGVTDNTNVASGFSNVVTITGNQTFTTTNSGIGTYFWSLNGSGNISVSGGGWVQFEDLSGYSGALSTTNSIIELLNVSDTYSSNGSIAVSGTGVLDLFYNGGGKDPVTLTYSMPISLGGSGVGKLGTLNLDGGEGPAVTNILSGAVTLTSNIQVSATGSNTLDITGPTTYGGNTISSAGANVTTISVAPGDNESSEDPFVGSNVTFIDDGTIGTTTVGSGGLLKGNGTTGNAIIQTGGGVAPGHSPGCLTVSGNLTETGTYTADLDGTTACTGYDQIDVSGTVDITGSVLSPVILSGFTPVSGNSFEILNNEGSSAITGTFSYNGVNLIEGSVFSVGNTKFKISYVGGHRQ